jgi:hypothetical protein
MDKQEAIEKIKNFPRWNLDDQWLDEEEMQELTDMVVKALEMQEEMKRKSEALCGITAKDAKSMMCTLDSLRRLVFAVHGLIDIVDDRNISKMCEILNQLNEILTE